MRKVHLIVAWVFCCTMAIQLPTECNADEQKREYITVKQILDQMAKTYAECNSYRDSGVVKNIFRSRTVETNFKTTFVRPDQFRFEFKVKADMQELNQIIWRKGNEVKTWSTGSGVESSESFIFAISGATGVSGGAALTISRMLLPKEIIIGCILTDMTEAKRIEDAKSKEIDCFRIKGMYYDRTTTLWIDKKTFLVIRIDEKRKTSNNSLTETTTYYEPAINEEIADKMLEFNPPKQK